ncbi:MAG: hypothetical protein OXJ53_01615 [Gammaproteobacteria bacterium]|nr:hypothetical protein [Gammaproteobacteria bacterium]MDE0274025.1 hypothetical protein [Gammaproteobacteria bacterium]
MTAYVVDTNVAIVANGEADKKGKLPDLRCQTGCVAKLREVVDSGTVAIDDKYAILREYHKHLSARSGRSEEPKPGSVFFKSVLQSSCPVHCVSVGAGEDDSWGIDALRHSTFDRSDRKFLAVAVAVGGVVVNATDSDWREHRSLMDGLGVEVQEVCPHLPWIDEAGRRST